jgi:hypothetical protein
MTLRTPRFLPLFLAILAVPLVAQSRKLGPDVAKAIQEATVDPAFQTTKLDRIALLPLANTAQFREASVIVSKNLVEQLAQKHPEYKVVPPDEIINFVSKSNLDDGFNVFLGDYLSAGTARRDFLDTLHSKLQIDAVLLGRVVGYGETKNTRSVKNPFSKKEYLVGLEMSLYRVTDGRRIWSGKDAIAAQRPDDLPEAAKAIGEVFARFLGRLPY